MEGILASLKEGLSFGSGDAVIGVNPVEDNVENFSRVMNAIAEFRDRHEIPTQTCVLAHVTTQMQAIQRGVPVDLVFQSIAGTESANEGFGITANMLSEAHDMAIKNGAAAGPNLMYFETGQGSEVSLDCHEGVDEMTLEARCYGLARRFKPFMLNNVPVLSVLKPSIQARKLSALILKTCSWARCMACQWGSPLAIRTT